MDIREAGIAEFLEELAEIEARRDQLCKELRAQAQQTDDFDARTQFAEAADLHYAVAYRCEQVRGDVVEALMFDRLDAEDEALRVAAEAAGAQIESIDAAVESTGHLPGWDDADPLAHTPLATAFGAGRDQAESEA